MAMRILDSGTRRGTLAWIALVAATVIAWRLGEASPGGGPLIVALGAIALVKGTLVVREFMELRYAPRRWQWAVLGWLVAVTVLIAVAVRSGGS